MTAVSDYAVHVTTDLPIDNLTDNHTDNLIAALADVSGALGGDTSGRLTVQLTLTEPAKGFSGAVAEAIQRAVAPLADLWFAPRIVAVRVETAAEFDRWLDQPATHTAHTA